MSNFTYLIYAILIAWLLPQAADLQPRDLTLFYHNAQVLLTTPVTTLTQVIQPRPGQGLTPAVRHGFAGAATLKTGIRRSTTLRTLSHVGGVIEDIKAGRFLAVLGLD